MRFDAKGMSLAFEKMQKDAEKKGNDLAQQQGNLFVRLARKLGWTKAPTRELIGNLLSQYGGRLKRKPGVTPEQEVKRRMRARGTFARRWKIWKIERSRLRIRIWIFNTVTYADVSKLSMVAEQAANQIGQRFQKRLTALASKIMKDFGKK